MQNSKKFPGFKNQEENSAYVKDISKTKRKPSEQKPQNAGDDRIEPIGVIALNPMFIKRENFNQYSKEEKCKKQLIPQQAFEHNQ